MAFIIPRNPTLIESFGQGLQQALPGLVAGAQQRRQRQGLQEFAQQQGFNLPQGLPLNLATSLLGSQFAAQQDPFGQKQAQVDFLNAQLGQVGQPLPQSPEDLARTRSQTALDIARAGQVGRAVPQTPAQEALTRAQTAKAAAETGIIEPSTLTVDQKKERDLIDAGINPKAISNLKKKELKSIIAKNNAEAEKLLRASKGVLTPEQKISQGNTFRKEFNALAKDFRTSRDAFARVGASAKNPSPAGDLALIFNFMKVLDPGSVVRESEFATAAATGAFGEKLKAAGLRILNGQRLTPVMRADFLNRARGLFKSQERIQGKLVDRYTKLSNRFGVNPADVVTAVTVIRDPNAPGIAGQELQNTELSAVEEAEFQQLLLESRQ